MTTLNPHQIHIVDETATGRELRRVKIELLGEKVTVRELIEQRVRAEVERHNLAKENGDGVFQGLIAPTPVEQALNAPKKRSVREVDADVQCKLALQAFQENGFFLLVGKHQVTDLDEIVRVRPGLEVTFVQLVALVGG